MRDEVEVLAATFTRRSTLPVPLVPEAIVIHVALVDAVQLQALPDASRRASTVVAVLGADAEGGLMVNVHGAGVGLPLVPACATGRFCVPMVSTAVLGDALGFPSATTSSWPPPLPL